MFFNSLEKFPTFSNISGFFEINILFRFTALILIKLFVFTFCLIFLSLRGTFEIEEFYKHHNSLKDMLDKIQNSYDFNFKVIPKI
jgi:hypothetical protein